jgi:hypothetical protein
MIERRQLRCSTDDRRAPLAGHAGRHRDRCRGEVDHAVHQDRRVDALQSTFADLVEAHVVQASGERPDHVGHEDLAGTGRCLEPGGLDHRHPVVVTVVDQHLADRHPDAHLERGDRVVAGAVVGDRPLHPDRRGDRVGGGGERCLHPVAGGAQDLATMVVDGSDHEFVVVLPQPIGPLVPQTGAPLGRADHVGEEDGRSGDARPHEGGW